jgi:transcriptional regulator with XRE-family HTH domain
MRRIALGLSVDELAREFGLPSRVLFDFERGTAALPEAEKYRPILERLEREQKRDDPPVA